MRWQTKLNVDHFVGGTLAWMLNLGARLLALVWKRDHTLVRPLRTVLFLKFTGLGSIARAAFLLEAAKRRWPGCRVAFACFSGCAGLVRLYDAVDDVQVVRDDGLVHLALDTLRLIWWSWHHHVDLVVDLEVHSKYSSVLAGLTLARDRAGFGGVTSRFRRGLYTHLVFWNPLRRVDLAYRQLGRALGLRPVPHWVRPHMPDAAFAEVEALWQRLGIAPGQRLLGVNPNASDLRLERRWPGAYFAAVLNALTNVPDLHVLLLGGPGEREYVASIHAEIQPPAPRVHNVAGAVSFAGFLALLSRLTLLLTNDSGPMHLAAALGTRTVSLWGPGHPAHYAAHGPGHEFFYRPLYCSPCIYTTDESPCGGDNRCLKDLDWRRVARTVCTALDLPPPPPREVQLIGAQPADPWLPGYWRRASVPLPIAARDAAPTRSHHSG